MRYPPGPVKERMARDGWNVPGLAKVAGYSVEGLRPLLNGVHDRNGRRQDGLTWWQADKLATALGCHPTELWDEWSTA